MGCEMVSVLQRNGIIACGKHFPGHGDTEIDSHAGLPVIKKGLSSLEGNELMPFKRAISEGVGMIMLGHLSVPSMDPSGRPASLSEKIVSYLRAVMGFRGTIITDAMNMGGIGDYSENEASHMALEAGADIVLHPTDPDAVAAHLRQKDWRSGERPAALQIPLLQIRKRERFSSSISAEDRSINFGEHRKLSDRLSHMAITVEGDTRLRIRDPFLIILNEDRDGKDAYLIHEFRKRHRDTGYCSVSPEDEIPWSAIPKDHDLIVCVYSQTRAWKGKTAGWLRNAIKNLNSRARVFVSFGNPYVLSLGNVTKIYAYWNSESAQKAVVEKFLPR
jgi:beta-N-acetylhexosaminidase